ncbi:hypothetical protein MF271_00565 (plasmid) [Deinococcus sp. KNUC1210]|uniref:hypothetical protein n=1 Tax=Deinococcus sp. KNUC1210 TaxID=2917691 RepID=UPI001EF01C19|nr:hypothetical protein [Deinococcus sp. KNUC1210]ULH14006.1 hypothetical protein MF271_00565 [Deinococcus sp. KNUC1210]
MPTDRTALSRQTPRLPFFLLLLCSGLTLAGGGGPPSTTLGSRISHADATMTALTTDESGAPVVAWVELSPTQGRPYGHLHAARWTGGSWAPLGGILNENPLHNAWQLSAVRGPDGQPWLGWAEDAGTAHVDSYLISRWDGAHWSNPSTYAVRRNLSDAGKSRAFTVTNANIPYLTWTNIYFPGAYANVVQPFTWLGNVWEEHAPPLNHTIHSAAFFPAAARGPDGTLYTAWLEGDVAHSDVYIDQQSDEGKWLPLGGATNVRPHTYTFAPQLAVGEHGPVVAWLEDVGGVDNLFVKRWTGRAWISLGSSLNLQSSHLAERPNLALDDQGQPLVAWVEGGVGRPRQAYAKRWDGRRWTLLGGRALNLDPRHDASSASVTVDKAGNAVVAWCERAAGGRNVVVKRFAP